MFLKKFKTVTHLLGSAALAVLALYGIIGVFTTAEHAFGAPNPVASLFNNILVDDASVPLRVNYQGLLRDPQGNPFDGSYNMTFRLYDDILAETAIWTEQHSDITVRSGHFSVLLGDVTPFSATIFNSPDRFIGVTVDPHDEMQPRQRFASVPYAIYADRAFSLSAADGDPYDAVYVDAEGEVGIGTAQPETDLHLQADPSRPQLRLEDGNGFWQVWGGSNYSIHEGHDTTNSRFIIEGSTDYVGLGTNSPEAKLHIVGPEAAGLKLSNTNDGNSMILDSNEIDAYGSSLQLNRNSTTAVNIGSLNPSDLDVNGNTRIRSNLTVDGDITNLQLTGTTDSISSGGNSPNVVDLGSSTNRLCFLTKVGFAELDTPSEKGFCELYVSGNSWKLKSNIDGNSDSTASCRAQCLTW